MVEILTPFFGHSGCFYFPLLRMSLLSLECRSDAHGSEHKAEERSVPCGHGSV